MSNDERQARIALIKARLEAATPGPWQTWPDGTEESVESVAVGRFVCHLNSNMRQFREDAALIANAPDDLAWLLSEVEAATARAERVEAERNSFAAAHDTARRVAVVNVGTYRGGVNRWRCRVCGREDFTSFSVPHADDCVVGAMERAYSAALAERGGDDKQADRTD